MPYTVTWKEEADEQLGKLVADQFAKGLTSDEITEAVEWYGRLLRSDAAPELGEARYDPDNPPPTLTRQLIIDPLSIVYEVSEDDCMVQVLKVEFWSRRP